MSGQSISASDLDLLSFFEVEPTPRDADIAWPHNDFLYETSRGDFHVSFSVAPAYKDVRIVLSLKGKVIYELNAVGVLDVRYQSGRIGEVLEVVVSSTDSLLIRLRPEVSISHNVAEDCRANT